MSDCIFCSIVAGEIPAEIVYEDDNVVAFRDLNPVAPTHVLVIPRKHVASLNDTDDGDAALMGTLLLGARSVAKKEGIDASGYRVVVNTMKNAGQVVFHVHVHVLGGRGFSWPPG